MSVLTDLQGTTSYPQNDVMGEGTNLLIPPVSVNERLSHFPEEVYDLSAESHLVKVIKVLIGEAGAGRLTKPSVLSRLQQSIYGSHFYDLDRFYGAIFGVRRRVAEVLHVDPTSNNLTDEEWSDLMGKDEAFRSRIEQLARAIAYGATRAGMELAAEAILNTDCDVYEAFVKADRTIRNWGELDAQGSWGDVSSLGTYRDLEGDETITPGGRIDRYIFTVVPKREITEEERYDLIRVLEILKPLHSVLRVQPLGMPIYDEVGIRDAKADSEFWSITQTSKDQKTKPPFSAYQGEAFSHLADIAGVSSYAVDDRGEVTKYNIIGTARLDRTKKNNLFPGHVGVTGYEPYSIAFTADLALAPFEEVMAGRLVSDGILVNNPLRNAKRGTEILPVFWTESMIEGPWQYDFSVDRQQELSELYSDGYGLYHSGRWIFWSVFRSHNRMWTTDYYPSTSTIREILEVRFVKPRLVNHVSLELARYPHTATIEAWSDERGGWVSLSSTRINESFPAQLDNGPNYTDRHPQHYVSGHWQKVSANPTSVLTERVRVVLRRATPSPDGSRIAQNQNAPRLKGKTNTFVDYSLAIRNLDIGYRIKSRADIPSPDDSLDGYFATTYDIRGNSVSMGVYENTASDLLERKGIWKSEPQPTNRAVVNLYLDARDEDGEGQIVDAFYVDPAKSGPHLNLYWSNDLGAGSFESSDDIIPTISVGAVTPTDRGLHIARSGAWVEVRNRHLRFNPVEDWWMALRLSFPSPLEEGGDSDHTILAIDQNTFLRVNNLGDSVSLSVEVTDGITSEIACSTEAEIPHGSNVYIIIDHSSTGEFALYVSSESGNFFSSGTYSVKVPEDPSSIYIGGGPLSDPIEVVISGVVLKTGRVTDSISLIRSDFDSFLKKASPGVVTNDYTGNSLLRYYPQSSEAPGSPNFRGGPADLFASATWHPIEREYTLTKGYLKLPPTMAKFWKMEFTNLVPEVMGSFIPIVRHVKVFPPEVSKANTPRSDRPLDGSWRGVTQNIDQSASVSFLDTVPPLSSGEKKGSTLAQYVLDPIKRTAVRSQNWLFGMQPWQIDSQAPRFHDIGPHIYDEFFISDNSKVGYFAGLKTVQALRTNYVRDDDTKVIREGFLDDSYIDEGSTWSRNPGYIYGDNEAVVQSVTMKAKNPIRAIQFAATQSDAVQIIPDDQFQDPSLPDTGWTSDETWHKVGDADIAYNPLDSVVVVSRESRYVPSQGSVRGSYSHLPDRIVSPIFSVRPETVEGDDETPFQPASQTWGGIESGLAYTSPKGMIHAAARIVGLTKSTSPVILQIIGQDGTVLAEEAKTFTAGEMVEWTLSYQLGSFTREEYAPYIKRPFPKEIPGLIQPNEPAISNPIPPQPVIDERVRVRIIQLGASSDSFRVDRLSIFDESIYWEFSVDGGESWYEALGIRNNPNGVLAFPNPSTSLRWRATAFRDGRSISSLQIRPWYQGLYGNVMATPHRGPNVSSYDHEPPIQDDPEFRVWGNPVPRWWWSAHSNYPILPVVGEPLTNPYSKHYARAAREDFIFAVDEASATLIASRYGRTGIGDDGFPIYSEYLPAPEDEVFTLGNFLRDGSTYVEVKDKGYLSQIHADPINRPMVDNIPTGDDPVPTKEPREPEPPDPDE